AAEPRPNLSFNPSCLRRFPPARHCRAEDGLDHSHVLDAVPNRDRDFAAFPDGPGKHVALNRVLVAGGEGLSGDTAAEKFSAIVDKNSGWPVFGGIERNLDLDASLRPQKMHPLVMDKLCAAGKSGLPGRKLKHGGS